MIASRMIPALWVRFVVVVGFGIFMAVEQMWLLLGLAVVVLALTGWQLVTAYRMRHDPTPNEK